MKLVVPSLKGVGSDIKKEGVTELAYDRTPTKAAATLPGVVESDATRSRPGRRPHLVYRSADDHVVGPASLEILRKRAACQPA